MRTTTQNTKQKLLFTGLLAGILASAASAAGAVQDVPIHKDSVTIVCTGVGSAKDNQQWNSYPVKLVFANSRGEHVADEHVKLSGTGGTSIQTDCDAPWLLLKAPAGHYMVSATLDDSMGVRRAGGQFSTTDSGRAQKAVTIEFPARREGDFSF